MVAVFTAVLTWAWIWRRLRDVEGFLNIVPMAHAYLQAAGFVAALTWA